MRAINVLLSIVISVLIFLLVFEGGLRLIGKGPAKTLNQFDPAVGWSKEPNKSISRHGNGWEADFEINALGLRDDPMSSSAKTRAFRVVALGDSFTLGFTVQREDLYVDLLEQKWQAEGRDLDVINTGTEGYSTDQEAAWLAKNGSDYKPDLVLLFPYENDIFWSGEARYMKFDKPLYKADGSPEGNVLQHPGQKSLADRFALAALLMSKPDLDQYMQLAGNAKFRKEFAPLLTQEPDFLANANARVRGSLIALQKTCAQLGAKLVVAPIPSHAAVDPSFRAELGDKYFKLTPNEWSPDRPVDFYLALCMELGIAWIDARPDLKQAHSAEHPAYLHLFKDREWHFTAHGNHAFASALAASLDALNVLPKATGASVAVADEQLAADLPKWPFVLAGLWLVLSVIYGATYPKAPKVQGFLVVGVMLSLVTAIFLGVAKLTELVPAQYKAWILVGFLALVVGFVIFKLGARILTVTELIKAFIGRGHWYLMPLVVVLLTIGSLLVVAASSPFVAPFIYTLF
jgi:lysophospholipase L1-like esterase